MKNWISAVLVCLLSVSLLGCAALSSPSAAPNNPDSAQAATQTTPAKPSQASANAKSAASEKPADTLLSFGDDAPSTQWFVNDVKIQDYA